MSLPAEAQVFFLVGAEPLLVSPIPQEQGGGDDVTHCRGRSHCRVGHLDVTYFKCNFIVQGRKIMTMNKLLTLEMNAEQ